MTALSAIRLTDQLGNQAVISKWRVKVKGNVKIYAGALCCLNGGYLAPWTAATSLGKAGRATATFDNTGGADGAITGEVERGVFGWDIGASSDALTDADIGATVYGIDDHTVGKTDGSAARSAAGKLMQLENGMAFVETV